MASEGREKEQQKGQADEPVYEEGEKVLAFHGPMIYQAKVQETEFKEGKWLYLLHYLGWSKKWDEWVESSRLLKDTPENFAKKKKLMEESSAEKKRNRGSSGSSAQKGKEPRSEKDERATSSTEKKRRKNESTTENSGTSDQRHGAAPEAPPHVVEGVQQEVKSEQDQFVKIPIPPLLKKHLVEDWRSITEEGRLVKLPRNPTVVEVLQKYLESKSGEGNSSDDNAAEVSSGLRAYFDRALPAILLYKQERQQYAENFPEGTSKTPAEVYGAEHLLRLFIKLPELLSYIQMDDETLKLLLEKLTELLKYLQKNQDAFFLQKYDGPKVDLDSKPSSDKVEAQAEAT